MRQIASPCHRSGDPLLRLFWDITLINTAAVDSNWTVQADVCGQASATPAGIPEGWQIREFQDDGIDHIEVRDDTGRIQVTIAYAAGVFWALRVGYPCARVSLPNWRLKLPDDAEPTMVHTGPIFSLIRFNEGEAAVWWVEQSAAASRPSPRA